MTQIKQIYKIIAGYNNERQRAKIAKQYLDEILKGDISETVMPTQIRYKPNELLNAYKLKKSERWRKHQPEEGKLLRVGSTIYNTLHEHDTNYHEAIRVIENTLREEEREFVDSVTQEKELIYN